MKEQLLAFWKWLLSYTKSGWSAKDYPLRYKKQTDNSGEYNIGKLKTWNLQVINWWMMGGLGDTKAEAFENFKINFNNYLESHEAPRPGTKVPLVFAKTDEIDHLEDVAVHFFENILDYDYYECFISDESSLADFGKDDEETLIEINTTYNLHLTDLGDGNLVRLFKLIKEKNS